MSAEIIELRPFQNTRDQAVKLGTNVTMAIIRRVRDEQRKGLSGNSVAGELQRERLCGPIEPAPPEAA